MYHFHFCCNRRDSGALGMFGARSAFGARCPRRARRGRSRPVTRGHCSGPSTSAGGSALAAIVKSRRRAARAIRADYPPAEREAAARADRRRRRRRRSRGAVRPALRCGLPGRARDAARCAGLAGRSATGTSRCKPRAAGVCACIAATTERGASSGTPPRFADERTARGARAAADRGQRRGLPAPARARTVALTVESCSAALARVVPSVYARAPMSAPAPPLRVLCRSRAGRFRLRTRDR